MHHFTRIVLVGLLAGGGVLFLVPQTGQIDPHHRVKGYGRKQVAIVTKGALTQHVVIGGGASGIDIAICQRNHKDLRQGELDPLAQLIWRTGGLRPKALIELGCCNGRPRIGDLHLGQASLDKGLMGGRGRKGELVRDPGRISLRLHLLDVGIGHAKSGLSDKPRSFSV